MQFPHLIASKVALKETDSPICGSERRFSFECPDADNRNTKTILYTNHQQQQQQQRRIDICSLTFFSVAQPQSYRRLLIIGAVTVRMRWFVVASYV